ncbi:MAG: hypothetical protein K8T91_19170 [Planctomycetes bacterium]|nr:hypothetical protein [Planctomycetota bacterium]
MNQAFQNQATAGIRTSMHPCWAIALTLSSILGTGGCGCSREPVAPNPAASTATGTAASVEGNEPDEIVTGGRVPPEIPAVKWDSSSKSFVSSRGDNQYQVHLLNDNEVAASSVGGSTPFVPPGTRQICFAALACTNPECARQGKNGRPYLFASVDQGLRVGENGKLDWASVDQVDMKMARIEICPCPLCHSPAHVSLYVLPEVKRRTRQLRAEMENSRQAYRVALQAGRPFPQVKYRTPVAIQDEINQLPRLFLAFDPQTFKVDVKERAAANAPPKVSDSELPASLK